jgi:hypothetical protein
VRLIRCALAAVFVVAGVGDTASAQDDPFARQRDAEAAKNGSTGFSISLADERQAFHPGEPIKLVFTFGRPDVSPHNYEHCQGLGIADAVLDHVEGTADPQADYWNNGIVIRDCGLLSGIMGVVVGADGKAVFRPIQFPVYLNQARRFDAPGRYRLYVRSRHRFLGQEGDLFLPPLISNIVEFEILPRDPAWEANALRQSVDVLSSSTDRAALTEAARSLNYLGTSAAIDEMAARFDASPPRWDGSSDPDIGLLFHWIRGLYGSPERAHVVDRMERELDRSDRYISQRYVSHLALLSLTHRINARPIDGSLYEALVQTYSIRHLTALKAANRLRQELQETLSLAAEHASVLDWYALTSGFAAFPDDIEAAFGSLTAADQRQLLAGRGRPWTVLHSPVFIPMLRRLANGTDNHGPQAIALRLLYDLSPHEGRQVALRELGTHDSAISIDGLSMLPDRLLQRFDNTFVQSLEQAETADQYARAMDRIERFASDRVVARVRHAYERFNGSRGCRLAPAALAYFFRVAPRYARAEIGNVMTNVHTGERCTSGVLSAIAARRNAPALEAIAVAYLRDSNGRIVADASEMLRDYGSHDAEASLWTALEGWHGRWRDQAEKLEQDQSSENGMTWEEAVEDYLTRAIMRGTAWVTTDRTARRLLALCVSQRCKESIHQEFEPPDNDPSVRIHPAELPHAEPSFVVHEHTYVHFRSRKAVHRWMLLHPNGTTFTWQSSGALDIDGAWLPEEETRFFEETRLLLESRGMTLTRRR